MRPARRIGTEGIAALIAGLAVCALASAVSAQSTKDGAPATQALASGLPVPRFVSLKSDRVNLRNGPDTDYPTSWVYQRAGLPLEVVKEFGAWRQVRDAEGISGWVLQSFLSGRRTALILPWEVKPEVAPPQVKIFKSDSERSNTVAIVEAGVIANLLECDGRWCRVSVDQFRGYVQQKLLWGVYDGEQVR